VVGSVDEATLLRALSQSKSPGALFGQSVKRFMIDPFPVVGPSTPMSEVLAHLQDKPAVLVVDKGWIAGIITKIDVIASLRAR
jgi:predicted transcriptional regulator